MIEASPARRVGTADEIAAAGAFLLSEEAYYDRSEKTNSGHCATVKPDTGSYNEIASYGQIEVNREFPSMRKNNRTVKVLKTLNTEQ